MTEEDEAWRPDERETFHDLSKRVNNFLFWLSFNHLLYTESKGENQIKDDNSKQQCILAVSHGVWIECLFHLYKPEILQGGKRVHNCDLYCVDLVGAWSKNMTNTHNLDDWKCDKISLEDVKFITS